jgi:hypothetical protein
LDISSGDRRRVESAVGGLLCGIMGILEFLAVPMNYSVPFWAGENIRNAVLIP